MISSDAFFNRANDLGIDFYTGVPCSFLTPMINRVINDERLPYVGATNEGEALAIAAGAWLAGRLPMVICQNSGLGNLVNPLTSLNDPFQIPALLTITWRGEPGLKDEPQHRLMGEITHALLGTMRIPHRPFPKEESEIESTLTTAVDYITNQGRPFALVMQKGSMDKVALNDRDPALPPEGRYQESCQGGDRPTRYQVLEKLSGVMPQSAAVIATTGKCGRELFTLEDRAQQLYVVGSMGGASAMGLGVATNSDRPVVVLDGDGAALMKMGNMATIGAVGPKNLIHVVLDNGVHDSTGGQATVSASVEFARIAHACRYATATHTDHLEGAADAFQHALESPGPHLIHVRIAPGSLKSLGRPTVPPHEVARRFRRHVMG